MCVCVRARARVCVCVAVAVAVAESERASERERGREREGVCGSGIVCGNSCAYVFVPKYAFMAMQLNSGRLARQQKERQRLRRAINQSANV
jgi:hypothetical protein